MDMDAETDAKQEVEDLEDSQLDGKIERTRRLLKSPFFSKLSDGGEKLRIHLQKLSAEKERRQQSPSQKAACETKTPIIVQSSKISDHADYSKSLPLVPKLAESTLVSSHSAIGHIVNVKPDTDSSANAFGDKLGYFSSARSSKLSGSDRHSVVTYRRQVRNCEFSSGQEGSGKIRKFDFSSGQEESSCSPKNCSTDKQRNLRTSKKTGCTRFSSFVREGSGCHQLAGKRRALLSLTPQGRTRKKVATLVVLDEEEDEQPKQQQTHKMTKGWMKEMKIYYPSRDHPESVEICFFDMECLAPFSYLSSPIMNFYIQYLQRPDSLSFEQRNEYLFFNTYFYNKLDETLYEKVLGVHTCMCFFYGCMQAHASGFGGQEGSEAVGQFWMDACDQPWSTIGGKADMQSRRRQENGNSFAKLRRWLKGVNIFEKAYIFLPIHSGLHWSLAIICFPASEEKDGPIILHLDSLGLHTSSIIFQNIQSYLKVEWEHLSEARVATHVPITESMSETLISKIKSKKIQVPQQENDYDCGLFVLFFMERFIKDAPPRLRKTDLDMFGKKWFRPNEASRLRHSIRTLLEKQFEDTMNAKSDAIGKD